MMLLALKELLSKIWSGVKKHWRWILFPVGILGFLLAGREVVERFDRDDPPPPPPDDDKTIMEVRNALAERAIKLEELKEEHAAKLRELSQQQAQELEELEAKPLDEVVAWFDKLSS